MKKIGIFILLALTLNFVEGQQLINNNWFYGYGAGLNFKMTDKGRTPIKTLINAKNIALKSGIKYCYLGNVHSTEEQTTFCPNCHKKLIERNWHSIISNNIKNSIC